MKKLLIGAVLLALVAAGGWYWYGGRNGDDQPRYRLAKIERGAMAAVVVASGTVSAVSTVQVDSPVSGQVKEIYADFNTPVKKGEVIARIDPASFELRVNQARAEFEAAEAAAGAARSRLAVQRALAAVKQRESLLKQAQADLERTVIRAPVDGTVILRNVDVGQTVAAGRQAPVLFTIAQNLRDMQVEAAIGDADVGRLRAGMAATFTVDAFPRRSFSGEIRQVRKSLQTAQNGVSNIVVISASNPDLVLLPGMTANVRVAVESRQNVLKVPNAALRWRPSDSDSRGQAAEGRVWVLRGGEPKPISVRLGLSDGTSTELVQSPLAEGAEVIVGTVGPDRGAAI